jgi:hypothetical protein
LGSWATGVQPAARCPARWSYRPPRLPPPPPQGVTAAWSSPPRALCLPLARCGLGLLPRTTRVAPHTCDGCTVVAQPPPLGSVCIPHPPPRSSPIPVNHVCCCCPRVWWGAARSPRTRAGSWAWGTPRPPCPCRRGWTSCGSTRARGPPWGRGTRWCAPPAAACSLAARPPPTGWARGTCAPGRVTCAWPGCPSGTPWCRWRWARTTPWCAPRQGPCTCGARWGPGVSVRRALTTCGAQWTHAACRVSWWCPVGTTSARWTVAAAACCAGAPTPRASARGCPSRAVLVRCPVSPPPPKPAIFARDGTRRPARAPRANCTLPTRRCRGQAAAAAPRATNTFCGAALCAVRAGAATPAPAPGLDGCHVLALAMGDGFTVAAVLRGGQRDGVAAAAAGAHHTVFPPGAGGANMEVCVDLDAPPAGEVDVDVDVGLLDDVMGGPVPVDLDVEPTRWEGTHVSLGVSFAGAWQGAAVLFPFCACTPVVSFVVVVVVAAAAAVVVVAWVPAYHLTWCLPGYTRQAEGALQSCLQSWRRQHQV